MTAEEMKKKAKEFLEREGIADLLIEARFEMESYAAWDKNQPDKEWNCGVTDIREEVFEPINRRGRPYLEWLISAKLMGINFKIGGYRYSHSSWSGEKFWCYEVLFLFIGERLVIEAEYEDTGKDSLPWHYKLETVEEFHNMPEIKTLLSEIALLIKEKEARREEKARQENEEQYKGKFDF